MSYTDQELKEATQVAYLDCVEKALKNLEGEERDEPYTVRELIMSTINYDEIKEKLNGMGKSIDDMKLQEIIQYSDLRDLDKEKIEKLTDEALEWKIVDIHDMNAVNGFYGCTIETSKDEAIVAFRGSEGFETYAGLIRDWAQADFGLLNSQETKQQEETEKYADKLARKGILDKYKSLATAGHSLGGNLASHFAVSCARVENRKEIFNKIEQVANMDGPGFSDEYLEYYKDEIEKAAPKITHYKWSLVGSLLNGLPGEKTEFLEIDDEQHKDSILDRIRYKTYYRHHADSIMFDENGTAKKGKQDIVANIFQKISKAADTIPAFITQQTTYLASSILGKIIYEKEDGKIGFKWPFSDKNNETKDTNLKCGQVIENFEKNVKKSILGAKCVEISEREKMQESSQPNIEVTVGGKANQNKKSGLGDLLGRAVNDEKCNTNSLNHTIEMIRTERDIERGIITDRGQESERVS